MTIQITEIKPKGAPSTIGTTFSDYFALQTNNYSNVNTPAATTSTGAIPNNTAAVTPGGANVTTAAGLVGTSSSSTTTGTGATAGGEVDTPSRRREPRRKGSLVVYDDQPYWNLPQNVAQRMAAQEANASASAIPVSSDDIGGELAATLKANHLLDSSVPTVSSSTSATAATSGANTATTTRERRNSLAMLRGKMEASQIYEPPTFACLNQDTDVPPPVVRDRLVVEDFPKHSISTAWIKMVKQGLSEWLRLPVIVCRGTEDG